jgi:hypothetical protein
MIISIILVSFAGIITVLASRLIGRDVRIW